MTIQVVAAPDYLPVTLTEAKEWARVEDSDSDAVLTMLLKAMTAYAENYTGRAFMPRTLRLYMAGWPWLKTGDYEGPGIELPQPPLLAVTSVTYLDEDGERQTLATDQYTVHDWREPAAIVPAYQVSWPAYRPALDAIQVNFRAGYPEAGSPSGEAAQQLGQPSALKVWISARIATLFEMREQVVEGRQVQALPRAYVDGLLDELVVGTRVVA